MRPVRFSCTAIAGISRSLSAGRWSLNFVADDNLALGFLHPSPFWPNSFGLPALPLRIISVEGSKMLRSCPPYECCTQNAGPGLTNDLLDAWHHGVDLLAQSLQRGLLHETGAPLHAYGDLFGKPFWPVPPPDWQSPAVCGNSASVCPDSAELLERAARAISNTRSFTLRLRSRIFRSGRAGQRRYPFHRAGQDTGPIAQQAAVVG